MNYQIDTPTLVLFESALFRTVTTLIVGGDYLLLVDPNWLPGEIEEIADRVDQYSAGRACYLLFTHSDYDHIIGYERFAGFKTIASAAFVSNPKREEILAQIRDFDDEYYIEREYGISYPKIDTVITGDGISMRLGADEYQFFQSPGHNADGILTYNRSRGILIVGDYLSNIEFPYVYHSYSDYHATLDKIEALLAKELTCLLITGHGDATRDKSEIETRIADSREYLAELEASVTSDVPFDLDRLFARYRFPGIMGKFHAANVELAKTEFNRPA